MRVAVLTAVLSILPALGLAQIGNPGFMAPDTRFEAPGVPAPNQRNTVDTLFAQLVTEGGIAEVTLGKLASERTQAEAVANFARRMVEDHSAANEELAGLAEASAIPLPSELNPEHAAMLERLEALEGAVFDLAYMRGQVTDHQKTTQLLIWEIDYGQDAELQRFAAKSLPTILDHLAAAQAIVEDLAREQVARSDPPPTNE